MRISFILLTFFLVGCFDNNSENKHEASLSIENSMIKGIYYLHAANSTLPAHSTLITANYNVINVETSESIYQFSTNDHEKKHLINLNQGTYLSSVFLELDTLESDDTDNDNYYLADSIETFIDDDSYTSSLDISSEDDQTNNADCWMRCGEYRYPIEENLFYVACISHFAYTSLLSDPTYCQSSYSFAFDDIETTANQVLSNAYDNQLIDSNLTVDSSTNFCLRLLGGAGDKGEPLDYQGRTIYGGSGGQAGFTQTMTSRDSLGDDINNLYFLLGSTGSSSIASTSDFFEATDFSDTQNMLAIAGGGGSGANSRKSSGSFYYYKGGSGGNGAIATNTTNTCVFSSANDGEQGNINGESDDLKGNPGSGGGPKNNSNFDEIEYIDCSSLDEYSSTYALGGGNETENSDDNTDYDGYDGLGGLSGDTDSNWFNASNLNADHQDTSGQGGPSNYNAFGGGGAGGGGGGSRHHGVGGGGGGGSAVIEGISLDCVDDIYTDLADGNDSYSIRSDEYGSLTLIYYPSTTVTAAEEKK